MRRFRPQVPPLATALAGALLALYGPNAWPQSLPANTLPTNGQVVAGQGSISQNGSVMTVQQASQKLVTHWDTFNIGSGATVRFEQPGASAVALNRVLSNDPSRIYGQLSANGQVFLVNPAGVLFGAGARVNVGGLVASTLDIADADFLAGRYRFAGDSAGEVVNEGRIVAGEGGHVALLAHRVRNDGEIVARGGSIVLAAAPAVTLDLHGDGLLSVQLEGQAAAALAANTGSLSAQGGLVVLAARGSDPMATVVNHTGTIEATALTRRNGVVRLEGGDAGIVHVSGSIDASGRGAGQTGGTVHVLGDKVGLFDGARIDASGDQGGGTVLVGGDWQGGGTTQRASATYVGEQARIEADALSRGEGGKVVVWADGTTRYYGAISARGGAQGGDGGRAEVSGKQYLDFAGVADLRSPRGIAGLLLLDPTDITISTGANTTPQAGGVFSASTNTSVLNVTTLLNQLALGNVTVSSAGAGGGNGDIIVANAINYTNAVNTSLTLAATRDILVNADIRATGTGRMDIALNANGGGAGGRVQLGNNAGASERIASNGGNITITGRGRSGTGNGNGILMQGATVDAGVGNISMIAYGTGASAMSMQNNSAVNTIQTTTGNITILAEATAGSGGLNITSGTNTIASAGGHIQITGKAIQAANGINLSSSGTNAITNTTGNITITGLNSNAASSSSNIGLNIAPSGGTVTIQAGSGTVALIGEQQAGGIGVQIAPTGGSVTVQSASGAVSLTGKQQAGGSAILVAPEAPGTVAISGSSVSAVGAGRVRLSGGSLTATAGDLSVLGTGTSAGAGVAISGGSQLRATSGTGNISITGTNAAGSGVSFGSGANLVEVTGAGNLTITGTSTDNDSGNGVVMGSGGTSTLRVADGALVVQASAASDSSGFSMGGGTNTLEATGAGAISVTASSQRGNGISLGTGTNTVRTGSGRLALTGTGGGSGGEGVTFTSGTVLVQTTSGQLDIQGTAAGTASGFLVDSAGTTTVQTGTGAIRIQGSSAGTTNAAIALKPEGGQLRIRATGAGDVGFVGDRFDAAGAVAIASAGGVLSIEQLTRGVTIGAGEGAAGALNWSPAEIAMLDGFRLVRLGNRASGSIDVLPSAFPFPVERPPASRSEQDVLFGGIQAVLQDTTDSAVRSGPLPWKPETLGRLRLTLEGFDDEDGDKKPVRNGRTR